MQSLKKIFVSDCEGPLSVNDNAYELAAHFIPNGDKLFANISKYDDVLADVLHRADYSAGSTLRLILPFLKAYDVSDRQMEEYSAQHLHLIPYTADTLAHIKANSEVEMFIVSTSYEHYIKALCKEIDFPFQNTYCTKVSLDKYTLNQKEQERLKELALEIAGMQLIQIPTAAATVKSFSKIDQEVIARLDEIFWTELPKMNIGKLITDVITVGGEQKAEAIREVTRRLGTKMANVMYVGDSITDVEAFKLVKSGGGLAVSFNGNSYAIKNAEVAVMSESNLITALVADLFYRLGKDQAAKVMWYWCRSAVEQSGAKGALLKQIYAVYPGALPRVELVKAQNVDALIKESSGFRKKVRGATVGGLG